MAPAIGLTQEAADEVGAVMDEPSATDDQADEESSEAVVSAAVDDGADGETDDQVDEPAADEEPGSDDAEGQVGEGASADDGQDVQAGEQPDTPAADDGSGTMLDEGQNAEGFTADDSSQDSTTEEKPQASSETDEEPLEPASSVGTVDSDSADEEMPAQSFRAVLKDEEDRVVTTVAVKAPEGAFPAGTFMQIDGVSASKVKDAVEQAVKDAKGDRAKVTNLTAVDIIFKDADGREIEPAKKVQVKITAGEVRDFEEPILVHVLDKSKESSKGKTDDAEVVGNVKIVNEDDEDYTEGTEDTMRFESRAFSPYVIVEYELVADTADTPEQTFEGEAGGVMVTAVAPEGAFPEGTTMKVEPVEAEAVEDAVAQAVDVEEEGNVARIAAVDITFQDADGNEVQPALPITVTLVNTEAPEDGESVVVHVDDEGEGSVVEQSAVAAEGNKVMFDAESFSVYVIVGVDTVTKQVATASGDALQVTVEVTDPNDVARLADLNVRELASDSDEYRSAYAAVVAAKESKDEGFDEEGFGFLAADISLLDADGDVFEPEGSVSVKMELLDPPADANALVSTMEVQHLTGQDGDIDVETVATSEDVSKVEGVVTAEFSVDAFSVFTLNWRSNTTTHVYPEEGIVTLGLQDGDGNTYAYVNFHYVDEEGNPIDVDIESIPGLVQVNSGDGGRPYQYNYVKYASGTADIESLMKLDLEGYEYVNALLDNDSGKVVTEVAASRTSQQVNSGTRVYIADTDERSRINGRSSAPSTTSDPNWTYDQYWSAESGGTRLYYNSGIRTSNSSSGTLYGEYKPVYGRLSSNATYYSHTVTFTGAAETETYEKTRNGISHTTRSAEWFEAAEVYLVYENQTEKDRGTTIHFVKPNGSGGYTELEKPVSAPSSSASVINFASSYTFEGYEYLSAFYNTEEGPGGDQIYPALYKTSTGWEYAEPLAGGMASTTRHDVEDESHIYIVYTPSGGATPGIPGENDAKPTTTKSVSDNHDGTRQVSIVLEGDSVNVTETTLANVLIVLDRTTSMFGNKWNNAKSAVVSLVNAVSHDYSGQIDFAMVTFGRVGRIDWEWNKDEGRLINYVNNNLQMVNESTEGEGTNWEAGLRAALQVLNSRPDDDPTYVIFITDGEANSDFRPQGYPRTDGYAPSGYTGFDSQAYSFAGGKNDFWGLLPATELAKDEAHVIAQNANLYGVYIFDGSTVPPNITQNQYGENNQYNKLLSVVNGQGGVSTLAVIASTVGDAFDDIASTITSSMGPENVVVDDGVPTLADVGTNVSGTAGGFIYQKSTREYNPSNNTYGEWSDWETLTSSDPAYGTARYDEAQGVKWDLSPVVQIPKTVRYRLSFTVWPTQEAYDLIADLNNAKESAEAAGTSVNAALEAVLKAKGLWNTSDSTETIAKVFERNGIVENNGSYTLDTNTNLSTRWSFNGQTFEQENQKVTETMPLPTETISVQKKWNNPVDQHGGDVSGTPLYVTKDGEIYLSGDDAIVVKPPASDPNALIWPADREVFISCGQIRKTGTTYEVIEPGHDYAIAEPESFSYYWDLKASVYHPMVINETATILILDDSATGSDGSDYYIFKGSDGANHKYRVAAQGEDLLTAVNDRRSNLNLGKAIHDASDDQSADSDTWFNYTVTINNSMASTGTESNLDSDYWIWFQARDANGARVTNLETNATAQTDGAVNTGYYYAKSGTSITMKIKAGWNVRFINLPINTTYTVSESVSDPWSFEGATGSADNYEDRDEQDKPKPEAYTPTVNAQTSTVSGTIEKSNRTYYVTLTNKFEPASASLVVNKTWVVDGNFVTAHGAISVALFKDANGDGKITSDEYIPNSQRAIVAPATSVTYDKLSSLDGVVLREVAFQTTGTGSNVVTTVVPIDNKGVIGVSGEATSLGDNVTDTYIVTYAQGTATQTERTDSVTNTMPKLSVNKTDEDGNPLPGATFKLTDENGTAVQGFESLGSSENNVIISGEYLPNGTYYLVETDAPEGYNELSYKVKLVVSDDSAVVSAGNGSDPTQQFEVTVSNDKLSYSFNVANNSGVALPGTGGPGTAPFYIIGAVIAILAIGIYGFGSRRKRERRLRK